jgi:hypothetical protein
VANVKGKLHFHIFDGDGKLWKTDQDNLKTQTQITNLRTQLETSIKLLSGDLDSGKGFDLLFRSWLNDVTGIQAECKDLIIVTEVNNELNLRIFDGNGRPCVDTYKDGLKTQAQKIMAVRETLQELSPSLESTESVRERVTAAVTSIVSYTPQNKPMVWLLDQSPSRLVKSKDSSDRFACGVILVGPARFPDPTPAIGQKFKPNELFIWVRRAYRSAGLGTSGLREAIDTIQEELRLSGKAPVLWARYPKVGAGDDDLEYASFFGFLSRFDFRRPEQSEAPNSEQRVCPVLQRDLQCPKAPKPEQNRQPTAGADDDAKQEHP